MAVYTHLTNEQITSAIDTEYTIGALSFAVGITQGVENTNYLIATTDWAGAEQKYILTLYEKRMDPKELPFFVALMHHLAARGVSCPRPIARKDGALFGIIEEKPAAIVSFVNGKSRTVLANAHVASVGGALAGLHVAAADFEMERMNRLSLEGWHSIYAKIQGKLNAIYDGLETLVAQELDFLTRHWGLIASLPRGVIHADLFPDNVFFDGDDVSGVIDFYFACSDALTYDVAITLNAWCFETRGGEFNPIKSKQLLQSYQKLRALNEAEIAAFPLLLRGAALRFLLTRAHDWIFRDPNAQVNPKDPMEYAAKLRFHQQVKSVSEYGLKA